MGKTILYSGCDCTHGRHEFVVPPGTFRREVKKPDRSLQAKGSCSAIGSGACSKSRLPPWLVEPDLQAKVLRMAAMTSSTSSEGGLRFFSGDSEDGREYKRWKQWVKNKLLTLDKLAEGSRGAYIYTLLSGKALEAVEHLDPESYQKKGGDDALWAILDKRFPQQETVDELGEILTEIFGLRSHEGESMRQWTARASELMDKCHRKTGVSFPDEARGWLLLHRAALSEEQKAVVIARARGDLKRESIASALRSCYPELVMTRKRAGVAIAEEQDGGDDTAEIWDDGFSDIEQLLEDHHAGVEAGPDTETFQESEVAEVLAATWKEKRQELNRLQKTRQFQKARDVKRSFRVEIEEMKRNSTCNRCGRKGHWARECRSKETTKGAGKSKNSGSSAASGAAVVQELDFVASVMATPTLLERVRKHVNDKSQPDVPATTEEILLVSSPGYGVLDSGCGRTIVGQTTLRAFEKIWKQKGWAIPKPIDEVHQFKFGNGEVETSMVSIQMPVVLAHRRGVIRAAVIKGDAPLLLSRTALKTLGATLDFAHDSLQVFGKTIPLQTNSAGQYVVQLTGEDSVCSPAAAFTEVMASVEASPGPTASHEHVDEPQLEPEMPVANAPELISPTAPDTAIWEQEDCDVVTTPWLSRQGPAWKHVFRRRVTDIQTSKVIDDTRIDPGTPQHKTMVKFFERMPHVKTEFFFVGKPMEGVMTEEWQPSHHQCRQLHRQAQACLAVQEGRKTKRCLVMEVFSPPRFTTAAEAAGFRAKSYDLVNGFDFRLSRHRSTVEQELTTEKPRLLVLCPPCTDEGGWMHLNSTKWTRLEYLQRMAQSRSYIRWCCKLFRLQVSLGGRAMFEHPTGSRLWTYPEVQALCRRFTTVKLHMCRYGLRLPESHKFIRKSNPVASDS